MQYPLKKQIDNGIFDLLFAKIKKKKKRNRFNQVNQYCIDGSKSIDLNESFADIDEFSILFVCLYRSVRGGHMLVHEQLMDRSRLIQKYKSR